MSCYLRHLKKIIALAGVEPSGKEDRKYLDLAVREIVGASGDLQCNDVWKITKEWLKQPDGEERLISRLQGKIQKKHPD